MSEQQMIQATMVSPAPGFTGRVMARVQAYERARARRRALIGAGVLAASAAGLVATAMFLVVSQIIALVTNPDAIPAATDAVGQTLNAVDALADAAGITTRVVAGDIGAIQILAFAVFVLMLTLVWVRVLNLSYQRPFTRAVGGLQK
jgi:hypothetical protein